MTDSLKSSVSSIMPIIDGGFKDFIMLHRIEMAVMILVSAIILNLILKLKWTKKLISDVINDTLKVDDAKGVRRFSGTKITMFIAFGSLLWGFHFDTISNSKVNENLFLVMAGIATGIGISKAFSKKLDPEVVGPGTETTIKEEKTGNKSETTIKEENIA